MRQPLEEDDDLSVWFVIDEETDEAFIEIESGPEGPDLSLEGDVIVAIGGTVAAVDAADEDFARAELGEWEELESEGLELMIRVGEWFRSWELE
jgi:hypothetical protein